MGIFSNNQAGQARYSGELHNLQLTQSVYGTTSTIVFGTERVSAKLLFYGGFYAKKASAGGGKGIGSAKGSTQYDYYADVQLGLAAGSSTEGCKGILSVWDQQGKLANKSGAFTYTIPAGGGTISPVSGDAPIQMDLGVSQTVAYSVTANDYASGGVRTLTGTQNVPMAAVVGTPGAGQYAFDAASSSYSFSAADAGAAVTISYSSVFSLYYFETTQAAEVPTSAPRQVSTNNQQYFYQDKGVTRVDTGAPLTRGTDYTESSGVYTFASNLAGVYVYINYSFTSSDSSITNTSTLNLTFFGGTLGQQPNSYWKSKYASAAFGYTGICHVDANPMALGMSAVLPAYNYEVVGLNIFPGGGLDAHFCDMFRTMLGDPFLGIDFDPSFIGDWSDCYAYWAANGYLGSVKLDTQTSVADAMSQIIETGNVGPVWSEGKLKLVPYGDTTCVGNGYTYTPKTTPVRVLTWNDLLPPSDAKPGQTTRDDMLQGSKRAAKDCWNYVQAQYCNRSNDYNNELINEQNDAFIARYGRRIESPQAWSWIKSKAAATWALRLRLNNECYNRNNYKFWLSFRHADIEPMDLVQLPTGEVVRITSTIDAPDGRRTMEAKQFTYGSGNVTVYAKQDPSSFKPGLSSAQPGDAVAIVVENTITQSNGQPYAVQIAGTGKNSNWGGANVYMSLDGQTYTLLDTIYAPSLIGVLSSGLAYQSDPDLTNTLSVDLSFSESGAELVSVSQLLADKFTTLCAIVDQNGETSELISYETATLTAANRYNLSYLRRGVYGSIPAPHTTGASFAFLGPAYKFATYQFGPGLMGHKLYLKLQSFNLVGKQLQDLSTCAVWEYTLGYQNGQAGEMYFPSQTVGNMDGSVLMPAGILEGAATIAGIGNAYDGDYGSISVFDAGAFAGGDVLGPPINHRRSIAAAYYAGFPSIVLNYSATLYIAYKNMQGLIQIESLGGLGGWAYVQVGINGNSVITGNFIVSEQQVSVDPVWNVQQSQPSGTFALTIPAGTDLSKVVIYVGVQNESDSSGNVPAGMIPGHIEIVQIWIQ